MVTDKEVIEELERQNKSLHDHQRVMLAGLAMQGRISGMSDYFGNMPMNENTIKTIANDSANMADELLKRLLKK